MSTDAIIEELKSIYSKLNFMPTKSGTVNYYYFGYGSDNNYTNYIEVEPLINFANSFNTQYSFDVFLETFQTAIEECLEDNESKVALLKDRMSINTGDVTNSRVMKIWDIKDVRFIANQVFEK